MDENQEHSTGDPVKSGRLPNGHFAPGNRVNPDGPRAAMSKWQPYAQRAIYWHEKLTYGELRALLANQTEMDKLPLRDIQIIRHIANTLMGKDIRGERESLLDRIEGKAKATIHLATNGDTAGTNPDDIPDDRAAVTYLEMLKE